MTFAMKSGRKLALIMTTLMVVGVEVFGKDSLVTLERDFADPLNKSYDELCRRKLFRQGKSVLRFLRLPGNSGTEIGITIYQRPQQRHRGPGEFVLLVREPSTALWGTVIASVSLDKRTRKITVKDCETVIPTSTVMAVQTAWLAMLQHMQPAPDEFVLDASREIFFVRDVRNRELAGRLPLDNLGQNTRALYELAILLCRSCGASNAERPATFRKIEVVAMELTKRVGQ
jgi:hypothetical protein